MQERATEHAFEDKQSVVRKHLMTCTQLIYVKNFLSIDLDHNSNINIIHNEFNLTLVNDNIRIIDRAKRWDELLVKEALAIKSKKPLLNKGLKASRELQLF